MLAARYVVLLWPGLLKDWYALPDKHEKSKFEGETVLHLAIVKQASLLGLSAIIPQPIDKPLCPHAEQVSDFILFIERYVPCGFSMLRDLRDMPADGDFFQCGDRPPERRRDKWNPFYTPKAVSCDFGSFPLSFAAATGGMFASGCGPHAPHHFGVGVSALL